MTDLDKVGYKLAQEKKSVKTLFILAAALLIVASVPSFAQNSARDEGGRVLGLETAWNHAIEAKDTKALDMILASTFVAVELTAASLTKASFLPASRLRSTNLRKR